MGSTHTTSGARLAVAPSQMGCSSQKTVPGTKGETKGSVVLGVGREKGLKVGPFNMCNIRVCKIVIIIIVIIIINHNNNNNNNK